MKSLLKNKEVRNALWVSMIIATIGISVCFHIDYRAGVVGTVFYLLLVSIYYVSTYIRYQKIAELAVDVNRILHGDNTISLEKYSEGELGILHSEIYKMTIRLREQQQQLINDKVYLADSIADISHQIKTPLTSINLLIQFLSEPNLSEERRKQLTNELYLLLSRIEWLITTLLKISKIDAGAVKFKSDTISMQELINNSCAPLLVPIELRCQELVINAKGYFKGDIAWTCEAIGNIVKNCMEHTMQGGKIEIETNENALYSEILIMDNGKGIANEDIQHIFERFYKGKDSDEKSFGIGLALSRMIITGQNGTVKAENRKPNGALFSIRFYKGTV